MAGETPEFPDMDACCARIASRHPRRLRARRVAVEAGVAVVLLERETAEHGRQVHVLLMRRAVRAGDPWSGHMSFPGGRRHPDDESVRVAAMRETFEETGLDLERDGEDVGRLSDVITRAHEKPIPMLVQPYVFRLEREPELVTNHEADELVWVPLSFFAERRNRDSMRWRVMRMSFRLPMYRYEGRRIWGLTLMMLDELIFVTAGRSFARLGWLQALRAHERPGGRPGRAGRKKP